jgi:hypothetical protein
MNRILIFLFFLFISSGFIAQEIVNEKHYIKITSTVEQEDKLAIETFLDSVEYIELVKIEPKKTIHYDTLENDSIVIRYTLKLSTTLNYYEKYINWDATRFKQNTPLKEKDYTFLYNQILNKEPEIISTSTCYQPRNGILFYNKQKLAFAFLELCFECSQIRKSNNLEFIHHLTNDQFEELEVLFEKYNLITKIE